MKLVAQIMTCNQTGPDSWETTCRTLEVRPETTVAEIIAWWNEKILHPSLRDKTEFSGPVHLVALEQL